MQVVFPFSVGRGAVFQIIIFIIAIYCPATINGEVSSNCTTKNVYKYESGTITCHFSEDISINRSDVFVTVIKVGATNNTIVCQYHWLYGNTKPKIPPTNGSRNGYVCESDLTTTLVVKIPNATSDHSGTYKCIVAAELGENFANCSLSVEEKPQGSNNGDLCLGTDGITGFSVALAVCIIALVVIVILMSIPKCRDKICSRSICKSKGRTSDYDKANKDEKNDMINLKNQD